MAKKTPSNVHRLSPPPRAQGVEPPAHLEEPERGLWQATVTAYQFGSAAELVLLEEALSFRQRARHCRERIDDDGEAIHAANGELVQHPLLLPERTNRAAFFSAMKLLRIVLPS